MCQKAVPVSASAGDAFQAVLGVVQNTKKLKILAVHNEGRKLVALEESKMSNPKIYVMGVDEQSPQPTLHLAVGTDPRVRKALLDGKFAEKSASRFVEAVKGALDGTAPAPARPVPNHYVQKQDQVPWHDPDIDLGFPRLALAGYMH